MAHELQDCTVAILLAPRGTEQVEFEQPKQAIEDAGGRVEVIGIEAGDVQAVNSDLEPGDWFTVDKTCTDASVDDYAALVVPGGSGRR